MPKVLRFMPIPGLAVAALLAAHGRSPNNDPLLDGSVGRTMVEAAR